MGRWTTSILDSTDERRGYLMLFMSLYLRRHFSRRALALVVEWVVLQLLTRGSSETITRISCTVARAIPFMEPQAPIQEAARRRNLPPLESFRRYPAVAVGWCCAAAQLHAWKK